jgi:ubiquinone/menaquinone biosynthesis C-methylase UbiE
LIRLEVQELGRAHGAGLQRTLEEQSTLARFAQEYERGQAAVMRDIERVVCGCDYGGTSWTTRHEADHIARLLGLKSGKRFLDLGAGAGWPGLYLARVTGCDVALADIPLEGLQIAARRAAAEQLAGEYCIAVADGAALPFKAGWFDAIGHSDVLCCLEAKLSVLKECRRIAHLNGRMVFTVISIASGLSPAGCERAVAAGAPFKAVDVEYPPMLKAAEWRLTDYIDVTRDYAEAVRRMLQEEEAHADALISLFGEVEFADKLARRRRTVQALDDNLLRRELFGVTATA